MGEGPQTRALFDGGRAGARPGLIGLPLSPAASLWGDGFRAVEIEFGRLFRLSGVNLNGERHASRAFQEDRFVLDPVWAKDEVGECPVGSDRLTGTARLRQLDDRGRVFG